MKMATLWTPSDSGTTSATSGTFVTQASDSLTTEAGDTLIVTESLVAGRLAISWSNPSRVTTTWRPKDSGTSTIANASTIRTTQAGDTMITQAGDTRVLNDTVTSGKSPTRWTDN